MGPSAILTHGDSNNRLLLLPTELITKIYYSLPSLIEAFALSSSCQRLRDIWLTNISPIYRRIGPRSIPCERYARRLLADQKGLVNEALILSAEEVLRIVKNSYVIEKAVYQYESKINHKVKGRGRTLENYDSKTERRKNHIYMTCTERSRFIRTYYQLWGLMKLSGPAKCHSRLESMTMKQLYRLHETCDIPWNIGKEEELDPILKPRIEGQPSVTEMQHAISKERRVLKEMTWRHIMEIYSRTHDNNEAPEIATDGMYFGSYTFVTMWDHYQDILKDVVCGYHRKEPPFLKVLNRQLWDDTSDEEI